MTTLEQYVLEIMEPRLRTLEETEVPTVGGGGSAIGGTIAATQVAYGTAADTIGGDAGMIYDVATNVLTLDTNVPLPTIFYDAFRQPTGFEKEDEPPTDSVITYNPATRVISIAPTGAAFYYWLNGARYEITGAQTPAAHANATGDYYLYWDGATNTLTFSSTRYDFITDVIVAYVYYNATLVDGILFEERHGALRNKSWHYNDHYARGMFWHAGEGLGLSSYTLQPLVPADADNQWAVAAGEVHDEDIAFQVTGRTAGSYEIFSRTGASGAWTWLNNNVPLLAAVGSYIYYNEWTGATWQLTALAANKYVNYYIVATSALDSDYDVFTIMGQEVHDNLADAEAEIFADLDLGALPFEETLVAYKITFRTGAAYGTEGKCRIESVADTRLTTGRLSVSGASTPNHNSLGGLQGGAAGEYYHITTAQHTGLTTLTPGRIVEAAAGPVLSSSTLAKTGAGVLTLTAGGAYTLTVGATSAINQDVQTTGSPTFSKAGIGTAPVATARLAVEDTGVAAQFRRDGAVTLAAGAFYTAMRQYNADTTNGNTSGMDFSTNDTAGTQLIGTQIGAVFNSHAVAAISADMVIITSNAGTRSEKVRITNAGNQLLGTTAAPTGTATKTLMFGDNAGDPTPGANTAGDFAKDVAGTVEKFAIDEAGNAAQLTPHNYTLISPTGGRWSWVTYFSNEFLGLEKSYDIEGLFEWVVAHGGPDFRVVRKLPNSRRKDWNTEQRKRRSAATGRGEQYTMKQKPSWFNKITEE